MDLHGLTPVFVVNWHKSGINYDSDFRGFELGWRAVPLRRGPRVGPNGDVVNIMARIRIKHNANELVIKSGGKFRSRPMDSAASVESEFSMDVHFQAPGDPTHGFSFLDPGCDAGLIEADQPP